MTTLDSLAREAVSSSSPVVSHGEWLTSLIAQAYASLRDGAGTASTAEGLPAPLTVAQSPSVQGLPLASGVDQNGGSAHQALDQALGQTTSQALLGSTNGLPLTSLAPPVHPPSPVVGGSPYSLSNILDGVSLGVPESGGLQPQAPLHLAAPWPGILASAVETAASQDYYFLRDTSVIREKSSPRPPVATVPSLDLGRIRGDFPALNQKVHDKPLIWLDNAATTHKPNAVIDAIADYYRKDYSNIHRGAHALAARSTDRFEHGREVVRRFLDARDVNEIVFVRGTTEAINLVAQTYGLANIGKDDEIIVSELEHHANIVPWQLLAERVGAKIKVAPILDDGSLDLAAYSGLFGSKTKLVAVSQVSNSLGTINPVTELAAIAHAHHVPILVDGAQSTPHLPISVQAIDADFFVFSGHKVFGPTGIGVLYAKREILEKMPPWQGGGNMIQDVTFARTTFQGAPARFEAGTPNISGVVGLAAALEYILGLGLPAIAAYEHALLVYATEALQRVPGLRAIGTAQHKASVLSFVLAGYPTTEVGSYLDRQGIAVRAGHHCAQPSLRRFGLESTVRPSLAFYNTCDDVDALVHALKALPARN